MADLSLENADHTVRVEWVNLGEGWDGEWDPEDPEDVNLLRFDVYVWAAGEWRDPGDASYCTRMPADTPEPILMRGLDAILRAFADSWHGIDESFNPDLPNDSHLGGGYKKRMEEMSWLEPNDFKEKR